METVLMYSLGGPAMLGIAVYYCYLIGCGMRRLFLSLLFWRGGMQSGFVVLQDNIETFDELGRRLSE